MTSTRRRRVVVDGSNLATEGRTDPSLTQLDEAVRAFIDENPGVEIIVVADASFAHRVEPGDRKRLAESELAGEIVTPPAGAVGRGDAFILKIADRINGIVLSNDSFQEFHNEYPWLFDEGRLIGGKPVPGVGWIFTARIPVRGAKSPRPVKKLSVALPGGQTPTIGTTLTPVKKAAAKKVAEKSPAKKAPAKRSPEKATDKSTTREPKAPVKKTPTKAPTKKAPAKAAAKKASAKAPAKTVAPARTPAVALRRGRQPVNPEADFDLFRSTYKVGARVEGEVSTFTSHGAVIRVDLRGGRHVECYAPTTLLGSPPPARARDVLARGDHRIFRLVNVDAERRIAELALP
jgi:Zc3h12a-like Ribonuclease NYN domain